MRNALNLAWFFAVFCARSLHFFFTFFGSVRDFSNPVYLCYSFFYYFEFSKKKKKRHICDLRPSHKFVMHAERSTGPWLVTTIIQYSIFFCSIPVLTLCPMLAELTVPSYPPSKYKIYIITLYKSVWRPLYWRGNKFCWKCNFHYARNPFSLCIPPMQKKYVFTPSFFIFFAFSAVVVVLLSATIIFICKTNKL